MATLSKLKPGDILYDVHSYKMGNTTMSTMGCWTVHVIEVHPNHIIASWNGNKPEYMNSMRVQKFRVNEPVLVKVGWCHRLATREELKAMRDKEGAQPCTPTPN